MGAGAWVYYGISEEARGRTPVRVLWVLRRRVQCTVAAVVGANIDTQHLLVWAPLRVQEGKPV